MKGKIGRERFSPYSIFYIWYGFEGEKCEFFFFLKSKIKSLFLLQESKFQPLKWEIKLVLVNKIKRKHYKKVREKLDR